jgi:type IV secretory pathway protease TraF
MKDRTPRFPRWALCAVIALSVIWATPRLIGEVFLVNVTPSVPMGLYVRDFLAPVAVGEIIAVDQPEQARRVLGPLGFPTGAALLKRVAAEDQPGAIFLIGDGPNSFDSRAFGAVPTSSVRGVYRQVLTW